MEPETVQLGMRTNCLPTEESLDLLMHHAWPIVAQIAGSLMASGRFTTEEFAVKTARKIVVEARKPDISEMPEPLVGGLKVMSAYTINGHACDAVGMLSAFEPKDRDRILALEIGSSFHVNSVMVVRRIR